MSQPPPHFVRFKKEYPDVYSAYENLGTIIHNMGPLDERMRALIKIGISVGARLEGAVHSHVRKALDAGVSADELRQAVMLALPTIGLPAMMAGLSWIEETIATELSEREKI